MKSFLYICALFIVLIVTGCWDRTEINDIAFVMGTAMDLTEDGKILGSVQIAIPPSEEGNAGGGGEHQNFFVLSATGKNSSEVIRNLQDRLSRRLFYAHRSVVFIGEPLAKRGIKDVLDHFSRDPRSRLRTFIMVAKGTEGRKMLDIHYPFELASAEAARELEVSRVGLGVTMRDLFMAATSEGINPVIGVIEPTIPSKGMSESKDQIFRLAGTAVLKDYKMVGFLDNKESRGLMWLTDKMKVGRISATLPEGKGNVGMLITGTKRTITPVIKGSKVAFHIRLQGNGTLLENNTNLDVGQLKTLKRVQQALESTVEEEVREVLAKVQKKFKVDVVGFGQTIYREQPKQWKMVKEQWDKQFPDAVFSITVELSIESSGMVGPPLLLKEKEIEME